jgi:diaminopropionate ammonia-lyase
MPFTVFPNPRAGRPGVVVLPVSGFARARAEIQSWPGYAPTPLRPLPDIARALGVAAIGYKDEASRFGLGSFKALGGAYAVFRVVQAELARRGVAGAVSAAALEAGDFAAEAGAVTVACATDGNHGRAVAWGARRFGCRCVIFVHETVSEARAAAIAAYGAEVRRVPGNYDDAVRAAAVAAERERFRIVSDTAWAGYTEVPRDVMQGYRLMADEAATQWSAAFAQTQLSAAFAAAPTHVFVQAGVGGMAAAVSVQLRARFDPAPALVVVEPDHAACLLASAELGAASAVPGALDTIMAGLACGEPSLLAWQELERAAMAFMAIPDAAAVAAMRRLGELGIVAGESGVAGLAGLMLAAEDVAARATLGLDAASRVLVFGTEGATDPGLYGRLMAADASGW